MRKNSTTVIPYDQIDYEIINLIRYINNIDGIETTNSCCGHGKYPCRIWFKADSLADVTKFIYKYLYCNPNWRVSLALTDVEIDNKDWGNPTFLLETTLKDNFYVGLAIDNLTYKFRLSAIEDIKKK